MTKEHLLLPITGTVANDAKIFALATKIQKLASTKINRKLCILCSALMSSDTGISL